VGNHIVPSLVLDAHPGPGSPPAGPHSSGPDCGTGDLVIDGRFLRRRELDLRRTEAPGPGVLPIRRTPQPLRHAIRAFDGKGRLGDRHLFGVLEWHPRMPVSILDHPSGALVVRRDPRGGSALTERNMVAVPAPILRTCGFGRKEHVLLVAVPSWSALVIHGRETLDRVLPDPEQMVTEVHAIGAIGQGPPVAPTSPPGMSDVACAGGVDGGSAVTGG
jgi:hypothetical protein